MSDASIVSLSPTTASPSRIVHVIAPGLLCMSAAYIVAISVALPRIPDTSAAIDVFLAAVLPGMMVVMLLWAARPAAYPRRRHRALVAVTLLGGAAASILPMLFVNV